MTAHRTRQNPHAARQPRRGGKAVSAAVKGPESETSAGINERARRDIVSGQVMEESRLIRFVAAPDGTVVPDVAAKLPGRGLWVEARGGAIADAVARKLFSRAARQDLRPAADLAARAEQALVQRMLGDLGLARRAGQVILGFDMVLRALEGAAPPKILLEARDGAPDGKRKLFAAAYRLGRAVGVIECLTSAELGLALGRGNVIHAAIQSGGLADRLVFDAERLAGFRFPALAQNPAQTSIGTERDS